MLSERIASEVLLRALNAIMSDGTLDEPAMRRLAINLVSGVFEDLNVGPLKKITCIKAVKDLTGMGLREAKEFTEEHHKPMVDRDGLIDRLNKYGEGAVVEPRVVQDFVAETVQHRSVDIIALRKATIDYMMAYQFTSPF